MLNKNSNVLNITDLFERMRDAQRKKVITERTIAQISRITLFGYKIKMHRETRATVLQALQTQLKADNARIEALKTHRNRI